MEVNMAKLLKITDPHDLNAVHDVIHDCYFDVGDIAFDSSSAVLSFRFRRLVTRGKHGWKDFFSTSKMTPAMECFLKIFHVNSYRINDTQNVGTYDFNVLKYNPREKCIAVLTGIPIDIRVFVERLEVSVEVTDNVIDPMQSPGAQPLAR
jgi:hypothetical protein